MHPAATAPKCLYFGALLDLDPAAGGNLFGLLGQAQGQHALVVGGGDLLGVDAGDIETSGEGAGGTFAAQILAFLVLVLLLVVVLCGDGQNIALKLQMNVLPVKARQVSVST